MMTILNEDNIAIYKEPDVVLFRNRLKEYATKIGMNLVNQTKLITASSELTRNMLKYAGGGMALIQEVSAGPQKGIRVIFEDAGPGIPDIEMAMQDGFSTGKSLGLGLPGAKRLVSDFDIQSEVGKGTVVRILKWKNG